MRSPAAASIVESVVLLAHNLGLTMTVEGVETEAHAAALRSMGCDEAQGHYFDRPMAADACAARLGRRMARRDAA